MSIALMERMVASASKAPRVANSGSGKSGSNNKAMSISEIKSMVNDLRDSQPSLASRALDPYRQHERRVAGDRNYMKGSSMPELGHAMFAAQRAGASKRNDPMEAMNRNLPFGERLFRSLDRGALNLVNRIAEPHGYSVSSVAGTGSMEPTVSGGNWIVYDHNDRDFGAGDVVAFNPTDNKTVLHRIAEVTPEGYRTQGDNNFNVDPYYATDANIHGKMVMQVPWGIFPFFRDRKEAQLQAWTPGYNYEGTNTPHYNANMAYRYGGS